jgi:hypothetical protein
MKDFIIDVLLILATVLLATGVILVILWFPILDRVIEPCRYYPNMFVDCIN